MSKLNIYVYAGCSSTEWGAARRLLISCRQFTSNGDIIAKKLSFFHATIVENQNPFV